GDTRRKLGDFHVPPRRHLAGEISAHRRDGRRQLRKRPAADDGADQRRLWNAAVRKSGRPSRPRRRGAPAERGPDHNHRHHDGGGRTCRLAPADPLPDHRRRIFSAGDRGNAVSDHPADVAATPGVAAPVAAAEAASRHRAQQ
ncbi:hypothetical protein CEE86_14700, partial [Lactobacillus crispatus]